MNVRIRTAAALLALPLALGACSSGEEQAQPNATGGATGSSASGGQTQQGNGPFQAQPGQDVDSAAFLQGIQQAILAQKTYTTNLNMSSRGEQIQASGQGDLSDPKDPKFSMKMQAPGQGQGDTAITMVLTGGNMYMQLPGQAGGKYVQIGVDQLAQMGGADLQQLMNPAESLKASQAAIEKVTYVGEEDVSGNRLKHYRVMLDPSQIPGATPAATGSPSAPAGGSPSPDASASASPTASAQQVAYDVWIDGEQLLRRTTMDRQGTQIEATMDNYGEPVTVQAPPPASVTTMPGATAPSGTATPAPSGS